MASFNKVMLMGNLTRDPQLKYLPSQTAVAEFGLACNRKFRTATGEDREEVTFVDVTAFGKQAEVINQYCQKGKGLFIEGRLKFDQWEDKQGGGKRSKLTVVVENFQFIGGRDGGGAGGGGGGGGSGGYDSGGGGGGDEYDSRPPARPQARPTAGAAPAARPPATRPTAAPARPTQPPAQQPFDNDEQKFEESEIPF
jgi:single-strand DNA-binding protein